MTRDVIAALGPDDIRDIQELLLAFVRRPAPAAPSSWTGRGGRSLPPATRPGVDETSFASLAAADFDASDQLAGLLGEPEFTALYHQGVTGVHVPFRYHRDRHPGRRVRSAHHLGMVRLKTREVVPRLEAPCWRPWRSATQARRVWKLDSAMTPRARSTAC
jgi:hypothetical protein